MADLRDLVTPTNCNSWLDLARQIDDLSAAKTSGDSAHWIYRGQAEASWWLKPSIERFKDSLTNPAANYTIQQLENQLLYDFRSLAPQFLANLPRQSDTLEWLAVLQHYGTPTRLLDWTYSPTVAAYMALKDKPGDGHGGKCQRACVWALNIGKLQRQIQDHLRISSWTEAYRKALRDARGESGSAYITPFLPNSRFSRMSAQQGLFLVKTVDEEPFMQTLQTMNPLDDSTFIKRLIIPHSSRISILAHLLEHNTHEVGLFPDADGLGRFVRTKVEIQSQTLGLR
jgi:hypothetical protein